MSCNRIAIMTPSSSSLENGIPFQSSVSHAAASVMDRAMLKARVLGTRITNASYPLTYPAHPLKLRMGIQIINNAFRDVDEAIERVVDVF